MGTIVVAAPCKVNLSLDISGMREDGYHDLRSVMQTVDLYDYVLLDKGAYPGIFIECDREQLSCDTTNTAYRAAEVFFRHIGIRKYSVKIAIIKNIPMQAGLGGGSSDAAAALLGLNRMFDTRLTLEELCMLGARVGADVPFCMKGGTVLCEGIGDKFTELAALPSCYILIAKPHEGISSRGSFQRYERQGCTKRPDTQAMLLSIQQGNLSEIVAQMYNVLEEVSDMPEIQQYKRMMIENGALGSTMTGSGSAVIGIFENKRMVRHAHRKLLAHADALFITRPITFGARVTNKA